jgi:hypothetical protein
MGYAELPVSNQRIYVLIRSYRHIDANVEVLIGFGNDPGSAFNTVLRKTFTEQGLGSFYMTGFSLPSGVNVTDGINAAIQVLTNGDPDSGLYNVSDQRSHSFLILACLVALNHCYVLLNHPRASKANFPFPAVRRYHIFELSTCSRHWYLYEWNGCYSNSRYVHETAKRDDRCFHYNRSFRFCFGDYEECGGCRFERWCWWFGHGGYGNFGDCIDVVNGGCIRFMSNGTKMKS